jgi:hypothetical protein
LARELAKVTEATPIEAIVAAFRYKAWEKVDKDLPMLTSYSENVVMLGVTPFFYKSVADYIRHSPAQEGLPRYYRLDGPLDYRKIEKKAAQMAAAHSVHFVPVNAFFCWPDRCRLWADETVYKPLFWDQLHMTRFGIQEYAGYLVKQPLLRELLGAAETPEFTRLPDHVYP